MVGVVVRAALAAVRWFLPDGTGLLGIMLVDVQLGGYRVREQSTLRRSLLGGDHLHPCVGKLSGVCSRISSVSGKFPGPLRRMCR